MTAVAPGGTPSSRLARAASDVETPGGETRSSVNGSQVRASASRNVRRVHSQRNGIHMLFLYFMSLETRRLSIPGPLTKLTMSSSSPLKAKRRLEMDPGMVAAGCKRRRLSSTTSNDDGRKREREREHKHFHCSFYCMIHCR